MSESLSDQLDIQNARLKERYGGMLSGFMTCRAHPTVVECFCDMRGCFAVDLARIGNLTNQELDEMVLSMLCDMRAAIDTSMEKVRALG